MKQDAGLRTTFRDYLRGFDLQPVETGRTGSGVPDLNYCKNGIEGWLEMKRARRHRVIIRPAQVSWIENRIRHGGRVFVAVRENAALTMFWGPAIRQLVDLPYTEVKYIGVWGGGPRQWDWQKIEQILLTWEP